MTMKKPGKMKAGKKQSEVPQGKIAGSGVNMPMKQAKVPTKKPGVTYSRPTQKQDL